MSWLMPDDRGMSDDSFIGLRRWVEQRLAALQPRHGKHGKHGRDGKDGRDGRDAIIDPEQVRRSLEDLYQKTPPKDGRDGRDGVDGESVDLNYVDHQVHTTWKRNVEHFERFIGAKVAEIPVPKDGKNGAKGKDGLRGKQGIEGPPGPPGPIPDHEWNKTSLRFEKPDGTWGEYVDLKGPRGRDGGGGGGVSIVQGVTLNPVPGSGQGSGIIISLPYGEALTKGAPIYVAADGTAKLADANGTDTFPCSGLALADGSSGAREVLLQGTYEDDAFSWTVGGNLGLIYLSTSGTLTQTQPSATDDVVQIVGYALSAQRMYFNPNLGYVTHT